MLERLRRWNDKFGWIVSIIALPSLLNDLRWWADLYNYILQLAPEWLSIAILFLGDIIHPFLRVYTEFAVWLFSWLPFNVPQWVSIVLPPVTSLTVASIMAVSIYRRATFVLNHLNMLEDPRFVHSSVVWSLIFNTDISLPEEVKNFPWTDPEEIVPHVRPLAEDLRNTMVVRIIALGALVFVYTTVVLIEIAYGWLK